MGRRGCGVVLTAGGLKVGAQRLVLFDRLSERIRDFRFDVAECVLTELAQGADIRLQGLAQLCCVLLRVIKFVPEWTLCISSFPSTGDDVMLRHAMKLDATEQV